MSSNAKPPVTSMLEVVNSLISTGKDYKPDHDNYVDPNKVSDGFHTFGELYECRKLLNAALFNEWELQGLYNVHKSLRHHDGELCFGGGWFIVVAELPDGQISFHYEEKDWHLFKISVADKMRIPFDGHTTKNVLERLWAL